MNRKFLNDLLSSIEDETTKKDIVDKIMEKNGEAINNVKTEVETLKNDLKVKEGLIENLNNKIKENDNIDIEAIKQEEFEKGKAEGSKEVETFKKSNALEKALGAYKAKDISLLSKLVDNDKITYEEKDGSYEIKGLEEQVKGIKETHSYLFEEEKQNPSINLGGEHKETPKGSEPVSLADALHKKFDK